MAGAAPRLNLLTGGGQAGRAGVARLIDLLFPRRCGVCGRFGAFLCPPCRNALPRLEAGRPAAPVAGIDVLVAPCAFAGNARILVHRLKYERLSALAEPMAEEMASVWRDVDGTGGTSPSLLAPVPLHVRRERDRGFNQSALLARQIARLTGQQHDARALARIRPTAPQARQNAAAARLANVAGAFCARADLTGRAVVLIDDVATTGATLTACAEALRAAGARSVSALVFARA